MTNVQWDLKVKLLGGNIERCFMEIFGEVEGYREESAWRMKRV
jgi:hypothetical protein